MQTFPVEIPNIFTAINKLAASVVCSGINDTRISALQSILTEGTYDYEAYLLVLSSATTNGIGITISGTSNMGTSAYQMGQFDIAIQTAATFICSQYMTKLDDKVSLLSSPATPFGVKIRGKITVAAGITTTFRPAISNELSTGTMTVQSGWVMTRKIA